MEKQLRSCATALLFHWATREESQRSEVPLQKFLQALVKSRRTSFFHYDVAERMATDAVEDVLRSVKREDISEENVQRLIDLTVEYIDRNVEDCWICISLENARI